MNYDGYIVSFMPGSRGRLIANITYKLINHLNDAIILDDSGSAHNFIDSQNIHGVYDDPSVFKLNPNSNKKPLFFTHMYPSINWPQNFGIIFINVSQDTLVEVSLNAAIKNIFPKLEDVKNSIQLSEQHQKFLKVYADSLYPNLGPEVLTDEIKRKEFLDIIVQRKPGHISLYSKFIDNTIYDRFRIEYSSFFKITDNEYTTLKNLCNFLNVPYNLDVHKEFEYYDKIKYNVFHKYYPTFFTL